MLSNKYISYLLPIIIICSLIYMILDGGLNALLKPQYKALIGHEIPYLSALSIDNKKPLGQNISEKNYVLHIFSSWCKYCISEHKNLLAFSTQHKSIPIYGLAIKDNDNAVKNMLMMMGSPFKDIAIDEHGFLSHELAVIAIPETIIVKDNKIVDRFQGGSSEKTLLKFFND